MVHPNDSIYPIFQIDCGETLGSIGISFCPGIKDPEPSVGARNRNLNQDIGVIASWGARAVLTLMENQELIKYGVSNIGEMVLSHKMFWYHNPILDMETPDSNFESRWSEIGPLFRSFITSGKSIFIHCRGGLGRSGMIAARLLVELGISPSDAIRIVREARPGAIETSAQEKVIKDLYLNLAH